MKNIISKILLVVISVLLVFSFLQGEKKKKKKNINKYIFAGGNQLIVFDGETKTVQKRKFGNFNISRILYYPNLKKVLFKANLGMNLYSVNINDLNDFYGVDLSQLNTYGKKYNMAFAIAKYKNDKNSALLSFAEWNKSVTNGLAASFLVSNKYRQRYIWNIKKNSFTKISSWDRLEDDPYRANKNFFLYKPNQKLLKRFNNLNERDKFITDKENQRVIKRRKVFVRMAKKLNRLAKKGKINIGSYNQISDLEVKPTGGRYMVVRNDKLYLVHMKTKKVYTLMDNPFRELTYFIIEKNEDDVDLDKE